MTDGKGLYLLVNKVGKYFRYDYRYRGKRKTLALGVYPDTTLQEARDEHESARKLLRNDIDPGLNKKNSKHIKTEQAAKTFEFMVREWFEKYKHTWNLGHSRKITQRLEANVFSWLGGQPVAEISALEILTILRPIEDRGAIETAHRVKQIISQVFRYAVATGRAKRDPTADLRGALSPVKSKRMATITDPEKVGELMRAIKGYEGHFITKCALRFAPLVFVRPGELRHAEWSEINLDNGEWKIPAEKMKMRNPHIVPISSQATAVLQELQSLTGCGRYFFPSLRSSKRPMSNNTLLAALRRMGYAREEMSGYGFRSMVSTLLNEQGWNRDAIERQLAHAEGNGVRAAYNYAEFLPERRKMMQAWADYLDLLAAEKDKE